MWNTITSITPFKKVVATAHLVLPCDKHIHKCLTRAFWKLMWHIYFASVHNTIKLKIQFHAIYCIILPELSARQYLHWIWPLHSIHYKLLKLKLIFTLISIWITLLMEFRYEHSWWSSDMSRMLQWNCWKLLQSGRDGSCECSANGNSRGLLQLFSIANYVRNSETPWDNLHLCEF